MRPREWNMADVQNYLASIERIQEENICMEDTPRLSHPNDSDEDEDSIID